VPDSPIKAPGLYNTRRVLFRLICLKAPPIVELRTLLTTLLRTRASGFLTYTWSLECMSRPHWKDLAPFVSAALRALIPPSLEIPASFTVLCGDVPFYRSWLLYPGISTNAFSSLVPRQFRLPLSSLRPFCPKLPCTRSPSQQFDKDSSASARFSPQYRPLFSRLTSPFSNTDLPPSLDRVPRS